MIDSRFTELNDEKVRLQLKKLVAAFLGAAEESILADRAVGKITDSSPSKTTPKEQPVDVAKPVDI